MGIPHELFVDSRGLDEFNCAICHEVFDEPHFIGCGEQHAFCHSCLSEFFRQANHSTLSRCPICRARVLMAKAGPAKIVARMLDKREVNCRRGCGWTGPFSDKHDGRCDLRLTACDHDGCDWTGPFNDSAAHDDECEHVLVVCERDECRHLVKRGEADLHDRVCKGYRCSFHAVDGCPFVGDAAGLKRHLSYCEGVHALLATTATDVESDHADLGRLRLQLKQLQDANEKLQAEVDAFRAAKDASLSPEREFGLLGHISPPRPDSTYDEDEEEEELDGNSLAEEDAMDDDDESLDDESMVDANTDDDDDDADWESEQDETLAAVKRQHEATRARLSQPSPSRVLATMSSTLRSGPASPPAVPASLFPLTAPKARMSLPPVLTASVGPFNLTQPAASHELKPPTPFNFTGSAMAKIERKTSGPLVAAKRRKVVADRLSRTESSSSDDELGSHRWERTGQALPEFGGAFPSEWSEEEQS